MRRSASMTSAVLSGLSAEIRPSLMESEVGDPPTTDTPLSTYAVMLCLPLRALLALRTLRCSRSRFAPKQQVEDRHAGTDPVGDLFDDGGTGGVGDLGRDLHAPVHRAGMHHDRVLRQLSHAREIEAVAP